MSFIEMSNLLDHCPVSDDRTRFWSSFLASRDRFVEQLGEFDLVAKFSHARVELCGTFQA
jgi:hypothetical protein